MAGRCLLFLFAALLGTGPALAGTWNAFGPVTYTRGSGTPVAVTSAFSVLNPNTQYTLHVVNGGLADSTDELVSSSVITVNGVQALGQNNFNQNVPVLDVAVTLQLSNTISVELWGAPGGTISVAIIGVDNDSPIIHATATPAANAAGWNNTSVTVSFTCSDATSGVASCPAPQTIATEGAGQVVSGTATDLAGNTASAGVTLDIDLTPPTLAITYPAAGATVSSSLLTVTGNATDALSGVASVTCNGAPASLSSTGFSCDVDLTTGSNTISVLATDVAGNQASQTIAVTLGATLSPPPTAVYITPDNMSLVVGEPRELALVDNLGRTISGATWTVSDTTVAQLSGDAPSVLTGLAAGQITISASFNDLSAQAQATVYAGPTLPQETVRWSVQPAPVYSTLAIVQAQPADGAPDIYAIEQGAAEDQILVRGLTADGRQLWLATPNIDPPTQPSDTQYVFGEVSDASGGLLLQTEDDSYYPPNSQIIRLDPTTGLETWRYSSTGWLYHDLAIGQDGTIYVAEMPDPAWFLDATPSTTSYDIQVLAIDGQTGAVKERVPVPESYDAIATDCYVPNAPNPYPVLTDVGTPMVAPDGSVFLEATVWTWTGSIYQPACSSEYEQVTEGISLQLLELRPDGTYQWTTLHQDSAQGTVGSGSTLGAGPPLPFYAVGEVIPDGQGGLLASWTYQQQLSSPQAMVEHVSPSGQSEYTLPLSPSSLYPPYDFGAHLFPPDRSMVLGENAVAFATGGGQAVSFNIADGSVNWTAPGGYTCFGYSCTSPVVAATEGNGLVLDIPVYNGTTWSQQIVQLDGTGQQVNTWTYNTSSLQYGYGDTWLAVGSTEALAGPSVDWPNSSFPAPNVLVAGRAYHHYDLEFFFCAANLCSPHLDTAFIYYQDNPQYTPDPSTALTPSQQTTIRSQAFGALKAAFSGYPVKIGVGGPSLHEINVAGDAPPFENGGVSCGSTPPPITWVPGSPIVSLDYYLSSMEQAQWALNLQISAPMPDNETSFDNLVQAIGRGIGNTAAHEAGHQLGLLDEAATGTYMTGTCDGSEDPTPYTGVSSTGVPIHWSDTAKQGLKSAIYGN